MPSNGAGWPTAPNGREYPEYNDIHNLFPAHQANANGRRSNSPFGIVVNPTYTSPTGMGKVGTNAGGIVVYEPADEQKGDVARALMYMSVCYHKLNNPNWLWNFPSNQSAAVMMQWHQQDPPSELEIARHEFIATNLQRNRNPFIDNPEWAERINFTTMTYLPTSVEKVDFRNSILTFPNPAQDKIFVDANLVFGQNSFFEILSTTGSLISKGNIETPLFQIDMPVNAGIYILKINSEKGSFTTRIVKD
jgi:hypothetical protein